MSAESSALAEDSARSRWRLPFVRRGGGPRLCVQRGQLRLACSGGVFAVLRVLAAVDVGGPDGGFRLWPRFDVAPAVRSRTAWRGEAERSSPGPCHSRGAMGCRGRLVFHSLGDDSEPELVSEVDDCADTWDHRRVLASITKLRSIFSPEIGNSRSRLSDDWPVPNRRARGPRFQRPQRVEVCTAIEGRGSRTLR